MKCLKIHRTMQMRIIENKEVFHLYYILGYYETEPSFAHTVGLKKALVKTFENESNLFPSEKLFM